MRKVSKKLLSLPVIDWPKTPAAAIALQKELREAVIVKDDFPPPKIIAGIDVGYDSARNLARASIAVLDFKTLELLETVQAYRVPDFPYIPGLLSFRELPVLLMALAGMSVKPDMLMVDGHGIAHPRRLGNAAHLGVITGLPSIGVAKSRLVGRADEPGPNQGAQTDLIDRGEKIGILLRSREKVKPLYISPGHRIGFASAVRITRACLKGYRLPEPTRLADKFSKTLK